MFWKCTSKFFTYELSRANTMLTGLAWALRETQGPAATPAAPAASFRKSRRVAFDRAGCAMDVPLMCGMDGSSIVEPPALERGAPGSDPAPAAMILPRGQGHRQAPRERVALRTARGGRRGRSPWVARAA